MIGPWASVTEAPGGMWSTILWRPLYAGSSTYFPIRGPVTPRSHGFEEPAEWLRDRGFDVVSWRAAGTGFRAELRKM